MTVKPEALSKGDTIALVSPANNLPDRFRNQEAYSVSYLEKMGYRVKNCINHTNPEKPSIRANTLMEAFADDKVKAILPICGGDKVYEILDLLDYDFISTHPKIICGYSFIGALLLAITERAKCTTFIGPHINFINDKSTNRELSYTVAAFWNMLLCADVEKAALSNYERVCLPKQVSNQSLELPNIYKNPSKLKQSRRDVSFVSLNEASTREGIVYAQSLNNLITMGNVGIPLDLNDKLLLLDTLDDSFDNIKYKLGILNTKYPLGNVSGIVFSSFTERTDKETPELDLQNKDKLINFLRYASDLLKTDNLYYGFPMGHSRYKLTLPIGIKATFNAMSGSLIYTEAPFAKQR